MSAGREDTRLDALIEAGITISPRFLGEVASWETPAAGAASLTAP